MKVRLLFQVKVKWVLIIITDHGILDYTCFKIDDTFYLKEISDYEKAKTR